MESLIRDQLSAHVETQSNAGSVNGSVIGGSILESVFGGGSLLGSVFGDKEGYGLENYDGNSFDGSGDELDKAFSSKNHKIEKFNPKLAQSVNALWRVRVSQHIFMFSRPHIIELHTYLVASLQRVGISLSHGDHHSDDFDEMGGHIYDDSDHESSSDFESSSMSETSLNVDDVNNDDDEDDEEDEEDDEEDDRFLRLSNST